MRPLNYGMLLLLIEFFDELVFGVQVAAWPSIRTELELNYTQIGVLLMVPGVVSSVVEPFIGVAGDIWYRRRLIIAGGIVFSAALIGIAVGNRFGILLFSLICLYPASGAFVSLSQATLMDLDSENRERGMAKWTFAGSAGNVIGPLFLSLLLIAGASWRGAYVGLAALGLMLLVGTRRLPLSRIREERPNIIEGMKDAIRMLRKRSVLRWLALLELADFMGDVLLGFLALYLVDVGGATAETAGVGVAIWTGVGLLGDFLLIPLLKKIKGLRWLLLSAGIELILYPAFLLVPWIEAKLVIIALIGLFNAGWYSILKANLYSTMPDRSGTAMAVSSLSGLVGSLIPMALASAADAFGLQAAMWLLLVGPFALLVGLPKRRVSDDS